MTTAAPTTIPPTTVPPTTGVPTTPPPKNPLLDVYFNCRGNNFAGFLEMGMEMDGYSLSASYGMEDDPLSMGMAISGDAPLSGLHYMGDTELQMLMELSGWGVANEERKNWVGWSKIGDVSFEMDMQGDAGFRPMSWSGYVYQTLQLDNSVVAYGSKGATICYPVKEPLPTFGFKDLPIEGIKNKTAVAGNKHVHFCIDVLGCLHKVTKEGVERLGYEEYLLPLVNPVLTWDAEDQRLYISSVAQGYVYNDKALTGGYANFTGLYRVASSIIGVAPADIITEPVEVWTDVLDFERRGMKSIESMQFNAISDVPLYASIAYRFDKSEEFRTTEWSPLNIEGVAHLRTAGVEFKIGLKGLDHGTFDLSYISIQFKFIDQRFTRDPKGPLNVY